MTLKAKALRQICIVDPEKEERKRPFVRFVTAIAKPSCFEEKEGVQIIVAMNFKQTYLWDGGDMKVDVPYLSTHFIFLGRVTYLYP